MQQWRPFTASSPSVIWLLILVLVVQIVEGRGMGKYSSLNTEASIVLVIMLIIVKTIMIVELIGLLLV